MKEQKNISRCKSCNAKIIWVITENNKKMPINFESKKRELVYRPETGKVHFENIYESHFSTCPDAKKFRKS